MASTLQKKMNCILMPSLEHLALINTAIALWNKNDMHLVSQLVIMEQDDMLMKEKGELPKKWKKIENKVSEKIQQLTQPQYFKEKISCFIRPIGVEILRMFECHLDLYRDYNRARLNFFSINRVKIETLVVPDELFWTLQGTINRKKTAEALIKDENLDIEKRYILACHYCLEKEIFELWNRMPVKYQNYFCSKKDWKIEYERNLVDHWTSLMNEKMARMNDSNWWYVYEHVDHSDTVVNLEAIKYFFAKEGFREIDHQSFSFQNIKRTSYYDTSPFDRICFLLSQLDEDEATAVLKRIKIDVLFSVLNWPWQPFFVEVAQRVCDFDLLQMHESYDVLFCITDLVVRGYKDYDYQALFREFWQRSPIHHKRYVVELNASNYPTLLLKLLRIKDLENFYLIFRVATAHECFEIFCNTKGKLFDKEEELYSVKFLTKIFTASSSTDIAQFVKEFRERILCSRSEEEIENEEDTWNELFRYVDYHLTFNY